MLQFWYEFASTYSYVAAMRVDEECARAGVTLEYRPFLLGPIFQELLGIKDSPFNEQPVRGRYMWRDLERLCAKYELRWHRPRVFPRHSVLAARVALAAGPAIAAVTRAIYTANFADDQDIADPAVLRRLVESAGADGEDILARAQTPEVKGRLRGNTAEAKRLGVFGAPDFLVGGELFFGQDRLEDAIAWATRT
jgi:2-hydroxychromene-2-carboxylate isomerase